MFISFEKALIYIFLISAIAVFLPSWVSLIERWNKMDETYSHGYIVLGIVVFYLYTKLRSLDFNRINTNYFWLPTLLASSLLWSLSYQANIEVIHQLLLPVIIIHFFIINLGFKESKKIFFPVLFLYFAIPFWDYLTEPLQLITVFTNMLMLDFIGIPAYIEGVNVEIPAGAFKIEGGCSGLRYLIVGLMLSALYSYQNYSRWKSTLSLVITAIFFSLLANWLRVFIIIVVGQMTDMESSLVKHHDYFGWAVFTVTLIPLFYLANRYIYWLDDDRPIDTSSGTLNYSLKKITYRILPYLVTFFAAFSLPLWIISVENSVRGAAFAPVFSGHKIQDPKLLINPVFVGADIRLDELFLIDNEVIQLSFRQYNLQSQGRELISYNNSIFSGDWVRVKESHKDGFLYHEIQHRISGKKLQVIFQYSISGYKTYNQFLAKLLELFKPLMSKQYSSVSIFASPCEQTCNDANNRINSFLILNSQVMKGL